MNVTSDWHGYTNACWAANWHRLFAGDPSDARGKMGWPGRFADALTNATEVFNYYSSGDDVFAETASVPSLLEGARTWHLNWFLWVIPYPTVDLIFENHCWQKQEVLKGMATPAGTLSGGWRFNVWQAYDEDLLEWVTVRYSPQGAAAAVADGSIVNRPAFDVDDADEMLDRNATEDDVFLALAKHVPAVSSPVGGMRALKPDRNNFDLNSDEFRNGWGRYHPTYEDSWLHSDMKDMAYFYVYKLYDEIVEPEKGNLK